VKLVSRAELQGRGIRGRSPHGRPTEAIVPVEVQILNAEKQVGLRKSWSKVSYPLVMSKWLLNMAIEIVSFPIKKWWFSIVMLVYQRVIIHKLYMMYYQWINGL
jgi:hypothetical protein